MTTSITDENMHDLNQALDTLFDEIEAQDKLKAMQAQKEIEVRLPKKKSAARALASIEYAADKLLKIKKLRVSGLISMFQCQSESNKVSS